MTLRLPARLYLSYVAVVIAGAATAFATTRLLAPRLFEAQMSMMAGMTSGDWSMMGGSANAQSVRAAYTSSLNGALLIGMAVALLIAGGAALLVTRRLMQPLTAVRQATRRIADGEYLWRVPLPREPEMAALAADVNTLAANLAATEQRRTRLLGDVAHEMRTPLTTLDGYVEGMIDGVFSPDPATLDALTAELRRLQRLADDLSALSRAQEQRFDLKLGPTDLVALVRAAATRLAPQFDDGQVRLVVGTTPAVRASVDADRVTQVVTNLLGNALVATPPGGSVTIDIQHDAQNATIRVQDNGVGLNAEDLTRVFERFYRAPGATRRSKGSGVGLTIAREIAHAHGGSLTVSSEGLAQGATFTLTLPIQSEH